MTDPNLVKLQLNYDRLIRNNTDGDDKDIFLFFNIPM